MFIFGGPTLSGTWSIGLSYFSIWLPLVRTRLPLVRMTDVFGEDRDAIGTDDRCFWWIGMPLVRMADVFDENTVAIGEGGRCF